MKPDKWIRVQEVFDSVVALRAADRQAYLDHVCATDPELRDEVERLLQHDTGTGPSLGEVVLDATSHVVEQRPLLQSGEQFGSYRIVDKIAEGGMGEVYDAEQREPIRRRVALKLIKWGMDTRQVVARFESERQALARMSHPNIANVFDAGATERGRPFFAMEFVEGQPITKFCDGRRLDMRQRIELFLQVCDGVQHAHQRGIIHRDLKPSNILVTRNGRAVPKIIDFGVAKATDQRLTEETLHTAAGLMIGTPEYMSPEQAEPSRSDVDTRTDVYSLGMVLYELLSGSLPFEPRALRTGSLEEIRRKIREEVLSTPSRRVSTLGEGSAEAARSRRTDPATLRRKLQGDLDWITMKALEKDRARRYGTPSELAADLRRCLGHEPVVARPPSVAYRFRKFARRHRFGVAAGIALALAVLAGVVTTTFEAARAVRAERVARTEAATAAEALDFLVGLFEVSDPDESRGNTITAREILAKGVGRIDGRMQDQPLAQARLLSTMGDVHFGLGLYDEAEPLVQRALDIRRDELGPDDPETLRSMFELGRLYRRLDGKDALALQLETLEAQRRVLGDNHPDTLDSAHQAALSLHDSGRAEEAEALHLEAVDGQARILGPDDPETLSSTRDLAWFYWKNGRADEARPLARRALEGHFRALGEDHPDTLSSIATLANMTETEVESEQLFERTIEIQRRVLGDDHPEVLNHSYQLGVTYGVCGRNREAEAVHRRSLEASRRVSGEEAFFTLLFQNGLARTQHERGLYAEAEALFLDLIDKARRTMGDHHFTLVYESNLGWMYREQGRLTDAEALYLEILEKARGADGAAANWVPYFKRGLADTYARQGRLGEAEALYTEVLNDARENGREDDLTDRSALAHFYVNHGRYAEAESLYSEVVEQARREGNNRRFLVLSTFPERAPLWGLAVTKLRLNDPHAAESLFEECLDGLASVIGEDSPRHKLLRAGHRALVDDHDAALAWLEEAIEEGIGLGTVRTHPDLASLRADPRYGTIVGTDRVAEARSH